MTLEGLLVHRVEVHRRSGRTDRFGQPVDVNPTQHTEGQTVATYDCRLSRGRGDGGGGGLAMQERSIDVFETRYVIYTDLDVDIREDDHVRVTDPSSGLVLLPLSKITNKAIASDGVGAHHLELEVRVQRGPQ